jgi:hypothetical protein
VKPALNARMSKSIENFETVPMAEYTPREFRDQPVHVRRGSPFDSVIMHIGLVSAQRRLEQVKTEGVCIEHKSSLEDSLLSSNTNRTF